MQLKSMKHLYLLLFTFFIATSAPASELHDEIERDYNIYLGNLFNHFHRNPELSLVEYKTAQRMAEELKKPLVELS